MRSHDESSRKADGKRREKRVKPLFWAAAVLLTLSLATTMYRFVTSYDNLGRAIQSERIDYVQEISGQIIASQQSMKTEYTATALELADILNHEGYDALCGHAAHIPSGDERRILLVTSAGEVRELDGSAVNLSSRRLISHLPRVGEVTQLFASLNYAVDCWLFAAHVRNVPLRDETCVAVVLAVSADTFRDKLAISLFGGRGASYIIGNDGSVEVMPHDSNLTFGGYNLLSSMISAGARESDITTLKTALDTDTEGSFLFNIGGTDWLISHSAIDDASSLVVAIPIAVTAADTYEGLNDAIIFNMLMMLSLSGLALLAIFFFFYRDRQRSRMAMAAAAKNDFLAKMSHDIRTPLNAVIGLEMLARDCSDNPRVKEYLRQSSASANYLLSIINDVLDITRIEQGKIEIAHMPFDMNEVLANIGYIATSMANEKDQTLVIELDTPIETEYLGDRVRVKQIIMNLMSNAMKFTKIGGRIALRVARERADDTRDRVMMMVSDTGIGMSKEFMSRIFTPFEQEISSYTQQYAGSGLGLSIVHNLVSMMHGTIEVESEEGRGSVFTVRLPLERGGPSRQPAEQQEDEQTPSFAGIRVLLAEDNIINQKVAVAILTRKFGLTVDVAQDGKQTVDLFAASAPGYYALILMDVKMPEMDGLEATKRIRAMQREDAATVPIVALSANAFDEDVAMSLGAGMNEHLSKPIILSALESVLKAYLRRDGAA